MTVKVKGYFNLQKVLGGQKVVEVEDNDAATLRDLLDHLAIRFGKDLTDQIFVPGAKEIAGHVMLLVNGRNYLAMSERLDTRLEDGDEVALFPPVGGG